MSKLDAVEFDDSEIEEIVEPVMEVVDAFADALHHTLYGNPTKKSIRSAWRVLADKILRFVKEEDL